MYAAIDIETRFILAVEFFGRQGTVRLQRSSRLTEKHDLSEAMFLVDGHGYQTALVRLGLRGQRDYVERNLIEKWFHTLKMRIDRFHNLSVDSRSSVRRWSLHTIIPPATARLLGDRTPVEVFVN